MQHLSRKAKLLKFAKRLPSVNTCVPYFTWPLFILENYTLIKTDFVKMSLRSQLKVPCYGLFYFDSDKTVSIVPMKNVRKVLKGDNTSRQPCRSNVWQR